MYVSHVQIPAQPITSVEIDQEINSTIILLLVQEGQLSVSEKYWLTALRTKPAHKKSEKVNWPAPHDLNSIDWVK